MSYGDPHGDERERQAERYAAEDARADHEADYWRERCAWVAEPACPHTIPLDLDIAHDDQSERLLGL